MTRLIRCRCFVLNFLLPLIVSCVLFCFTVAQREGYGVPQSQQNRRFSLSTEAPMTKAINELTPAAIPYIDLLIQHVARVESAVLTALKVDPVQACSTLMTYRYAWSVRREFARRGFPDLGANCPTDVSGVNFDGGITEYTLDELYHAAFNRGAEIKKRINEIALRMIDNFTRPEVLFNFAYKTKSAQCSLTPVCMYRVGQFWHQELGIHSHGLDDHLAPGDRLDIFELSRVVNGELGDNLTMRLPKYANGSIERRFVDNTTTMIQNSRALYPSCFRGISIGHNPAIIQALHEVDNFAQRAENALASSNLADFLLPLALSTVPISLFTDVSSRFMLFYMFMSDVLTVIPLGILGIELLIISSSRSRVVTTRMTSGVMGNITNTEAAAAEIWGAECRLQGHVRRTGIALTTTAVVFLVFGVGLEFGTWAYSQKRRRRGKRLLFCGSRRASSYAYTCSDRYSDTLISSDIPELEEDERYLIEESSDLGITSNK